VTVSDDAERVDRWGVERVSASPCTVAVRSDVPLLRLGLERAVRLAGMRTVADRAAGCDIVIEAAGEPGREQVTVVVRSPTNRQTWVALGQLIERFERTFETSVNPPRRCRRSGPP
jgi:hypothetical protein